MLSDSAALANIAAVPLTERMPPRMRLIFETIMEAQHSPLGDMLLIQEAAAKILALDIEFALCAEEARTKRLHSNAEPMLAVLQELQAAHARSKADEDGPGHYFPLKVEQALSKADRIIERVKGDSL